MMKELDFQADGAMDARLQSFLGRRLRKEYDNVVTERLPDQWVSLLNELAQREAESGRTTERPA